MRSRIFSWVVVMNLMCNKCWERPARVGQRTCRECHAEVMRAARAEAKRERERRERERHLLQEFAWLKNGFCQPGGVVVLSFDTEGQLT